MIMIKQRAITAIMMIALFFCVGRSLTAQEIITDPSVLGAKLQNPYSVQNMQMAWSNIKPKLVSSGRIAGDEVEVVATHYYVRFLPSDSLELELLLEDTALELYTFPLDYDVQMVGEFYYHDPEIPLGAPTYQYTVVLADYKFPDIQYEILSELYLPDEEGHTETGRVISPIDNCLQAQLVNEAMSLTGNYDEIVTVNCEIGSTSTEPITAGVCTKCPQGQILVENPESGTIVRGGVKYDGVPEVKARARKWFKIKTAETNENGEFIINHVFGGNRKVNYGIKYTNNHAFIKPVTIGFGPAFLNGPKSSGRWEYRSHRGSSSYLWGTIMRGVYDYHHIYSALFNIGSPPNNIKIRSCANNECGITTMLHTLAAPGGPFGGWLFSDVKIGSADTEYNKLYKTVIHELGHAAHWKLGGDWPWSRSFDMMFSHKLVREAWACGVADAAHDVKFLRRWYAACPTGGLEDMLDDGYPRVLVRDLIDDTNEFNEGISSCNVIDNVEGFTLHEIFYALENINALAIGDNDSALKKWRDNLIEIRPLQEEVLREYFAQWTDEKYVPCNGLPKVLDSDLTNVVTASYTHSNTIILKDGFRFKAINSDYIFNANIFCPLQQENTGSIAGKVDSQFTHETRKDENEDFVYSGRPNVSLITHLQPYEETPKEEVVSVNEEPLVFYPNPAIEELTVHEEGSFVVIICDSQGNVIFKSLKNEDVATIGLQEFVPSIYILKVVSGNSVKSEIFIKK